MDARGVIIAPGQTVASLYLERLPLYLAYADATVLTDERTPDQVVGRVFDALGRLSPF